MTKPTNVEMALKYLKYAKNLLAIEIQAELNGGRGDAPNYGRVGSLNDFALQVEKVISTDHGAAGLEVYIQNFEKGRKRS